MKDDKLGPARKQAYPYARTNKIVVASLAVQAIILGPAMAQMSSNRLMVEGVAQALHASKQPASSWPAATEKKYKIVDGSAQAVRPALNASAGAGTSRSAESLNIFLQMPGEAQAPSRTQRRTRAVAATPQPAIYIAPSNVTRVWPVKPRVHQPIKHLVFSNDLLFEPSSAKLTTAGEAKLLSLAGLLRNDPDHPIVIVGHSDNLGFERANKSLSLHCAERLKTWLVSRGLAKSYAIEVRGAGGAEPLVSERLPGNRDNAAGRARNRRIEVTIDPNQDLATLRATAEADAEERAAAAKATALTKAAQEKDVDRSLISREDPNEAAAGADPGMTMIPVTEDMLTEHLNPANAATPGETQSQGAMQGAGHVSNGAEWGTGGTDFGRNVQPPTYNGGANMGGGFSGGPGDEYNEEGKRVKRIPNETETPAARRQETTEAQKEFGLFNGH